MKSESKSQIKMVVIVTISVVVVFYLLYLAITLIFNQEKYNEMGYSKVAEVIDGDTFKTNDGEIIRLLCVDTPERGKEGYDDATVFLREKLFNSEVRLEGNKTDKYGRSLRWVYADDVLINKEIVDFGFGILLEYDDEDCELMK
ncbi:thermonuclease precursor [archaeon BMS3Abin17]|nr:thermonuclease precursor [archaeon BMS3Abin17]HDZ60693.1 hypothetical protein [Candidatus Pacearchaeota archaeon]